MVAESIKYTRVVVRHKDQKVRKRPKPSPTIERLRKSLKK